MSSKVLILTTSYAPLIGGSELAVEHIARELPQYEFDVVTARFSFANPAYEFVNNVSIYRVGGPWVLGKLGLPKLFLPLVLFWKAWQLSRRNHYKIIHAYQASQAAGAAWLLKLLYPRTHFILTIQEGKNLDNQNFIMRWFRRLLVRAADHITVISRYLQNYVLSINPKARISLVPNGVDWENLSTPVPSDQVAALKQKLGIKVSERVIITIGRLVSKNGVAELIRGFALLSNHDTKLVLVGGQSLGGSDNVSEAYLHKMTSELGITSRVIFTGEISHARIGDFLSIADVFIRPSQSEGFGSAFLEAMAAGVPVIGTNVGGIPDFLTDGQTGVVCRREDPTDIARAIDRILSDSPLRATIVNNARQLVKDKYDWSIVARSVDAIYLSYL